MSCTLPAKTPEELEAVVRAVAPKLVTWPPGLSGLHSLDVLAHLGVKRVSPARPGARYLRRFPPSCAGVKAKGTFDFGRTAFPTPKSTRCSRGQCVSWARRTSRRTGSDESTLSCIRAPRAAASRPNHERRESRSASSRRPRGRAMLSLMPRTSAEEVRRPGPPRGAGRRLAERRRTRIRRLRQPRQDQRQRNAAKRRDPRGAGLRGADQRAVET